MQSRKATSQDMRVVFTDLAQRSVDEMHAAEYTLHDVKDVFRKLRKSGDLWSLVVDDEPIGLIGFRRDEHEGSPITASYFVGREAFFDPAVPSARFGRRFMREMQVQYGNLPLVSMCYGRHLEIERWYRIMGYRLAETLGVQRNFVLDPVS
ncbi:hypothetical protein [Rhizobium leguminosarum]|uniref:hypothetical protein n=1 Tax=Rhizobium leguminosarum TaxID=384 RepID=UPI00140F579D|nr:hypothetical protein [Rhizobium leguminosarum]QIO64800.1 hypothetical protein HA462_06975 [Rhizobium leguminosarum bv. trifolii]